MGMEKRAYMAYHGDGLVDLALGLVILLFGLGMQYDQTLLAPIFGAVAYPVWLVAKQKITERRLGYVEFSDRRKRKEKRGMISLFVLGCLICLMGIAIYLILTRGESPKGILMESGILLLGFMFGLMISSVGLALGVIRLHMYSLLVILLVSLGHFLNWPKSYGVILPGSTIVICGTLLLITFIRRYPIADDGEGSESV